MSSIRKKGNDKLIILKCTSSYPAETTKLNLNTMSDISKKFNCLSGFSDHTTNINIPIHAASIGASMIEKHVCLKNKKTVDSFFSIDTKECNKMAKIIKNNKKSEGKISYELPSSSRKNFLR